MKNMLDCREYSAQELHEIINKAQMIKANEPKFSDILNGKKLYTLFEKTSTRTFLSFATGITELGGSYYNQLWKDSNFVLGDPVSEIKYIGRNVDIIMARLKKNEMVQVFGKNTTVPFINGCDNTFHPCQALADMLTIKEKFGSFDVKFLYIGAKNNVLNSLIDTLPRLGGKLYSFTPISNEMNIDEDFYANAKETGNFIELDTNMKYEELQELVKGIDVVYTDTWVDMEFFNNPDCVDYKIHTVDKMMPYQVDEKLMGDSKAIVLHDMPMHIGFEISQQIVDKHLEHILDQAENRRHIEKAIMVTLLWQDEMKKYFE